MAVREILKMGNPYPNPAKDINKISIMLPEATANYDILLSLYDANGSKLATIAEGKYEAGFYIFEVD